MHTQRSAFVLSVTAIGVLAAACSAPHSDDPEIIATVTEPPGGRGQSAASAPRPADGAVLVLLSVAAGCVDAASFLGLGQVLPAAMTGNTVLLGLALGQAELQAALRSVVALLGFFSGVLLGASIVRPSPGRL